MSEGKKDSEYVRKVACHVARKISRWDLLEDLTQSGWVGFLKAKKSWNGVGSLYGHAFARTKGEMLDFVRKNNNANRHSKKYNPSHVVVSLDDMEDMPEASCTPDYVEMVYLTRHHGKLHGRSLDIWDMHCMGYTGREIAKKFNLHDSRVCHILKDIKNIIK